MDGIRQGDQVEVDTVTGMIRNLSTKAEFQAAPFPEFLQRIISLGGLLPYVEEKLAER